MVNKIKTGDRIESVRIVRVGEDAEKFVCTKQAFSDLVEKIENEALKKEAEEQQKIDREISNRYPGAVSTPSGLKYVVLKEGTGTASPKWGQAVTVHYQGTFLNGKIFDSSILRNEPATF